MTEPGNQIVGGEEFACLMAALGFFGQKPRIAVACSGGADSMALALLASEWARAQGGEATALIVDHAIRPESAGEAAAVARELRRHGVRHEVLRYGGPAITDAIQAAARRVRYDLLSDWCVRHGCLHLATAHHREDQAETMLLRLARGSGIDGLAAMAPVTETRDLRILRPLLSVSRNRLRATVDRRGAWFVDDPSNRDPRFARVRMRAITGALAAEGLSAERLAATARRAARARSALEGDVAALLARAVVLYPLGYARLCADVLRAAPEETALRALARLVTCLGGNDYPPRLARVERLHDWILCGASGGGRTLAGCRIVPRRGSLLVCRESAAADAVQPARGTVHWDGRFRLRFAARGTGEVRRLGREGWRQAVADQPELRRAPLPALARLALPAVWRQDRLASVPSLGYSRLDCSKDRQRAVPVLFAPIRPLTSARFTLQKGGYTLSK